MRYFYVLIIFFLASCQTLKTQDYRKGKEILLIKKHIIENVSKAFSGLYNISGNGWTNRIVVDTLGNEFIEPVLSEIFLSESTFPNLVKKDFYRSLSKDDYQFLQAQVGELIVFTKDDFDGEITIISDIKNSPEKYASSLTVSKPIFTKDGNTAFITSWITKKKYRRLYVYEFRNNDWLLIARYELGMGYQ